MFHIFLSMLHPSGVTFGINCHGNRKALETQVGTKGRMHKPRMAGVHATDASWGFSHSPSPGNQPTHPNINIYLGYSLQIR